MIGNRQQNDADENNRRAATEGTSVLVNQVGFNTSGIKRFVVQLPQGSGLWPTGFRIRTSNGRVAYTGRLFMAEGPIAWNSVFWKGDFSGFEQSGRFFVELVLATRSGRMKTIRSYKFGVMKDLLRQETIIPAAKFFYYQRCGFSVPGWHAQCHLDDGILPDGTYIDAAGGWHDAGDYNKYSGYTPLTVYALAYGYQKSLGKIEAKESKRLIDESRWGARWLMKMLNIETGLFWGDVFSGYDYWGPPEGETANTAESRGGRPIRDQRRLPMAAAALAKVYAATSKVKYLEAAESAWKASIAEESPNSIFLSEQLLAAHELYRVTKKDEYLEAAKDRAALLLGCQHKSGGFGASICDQGLPVAALSMFVLDHPMEEISEPVREALERYLAYSQKLSSNIFGITQWTDKDFFFPYENEDSWYVGQNSQYLSQAWGMLLLAKVLGGEVAVRAEGIAADQVDWVLGRNPYAVCMFEGRGSFNPPKYHHRYDSVPHRQRGAVPGTICGGIVRKSPAEDVPKFDTSGNDLHSNEPWLPHNAYFILAVSEA
ncbi:MAG TPA: glycoside hydrolase family 9 protein [Planctomycetota bacterium]|nr:glycoside hydrolase family 9 protein [Planctomycetota bacterium]